MRLPSKRTAAFVALAVFLAGCGGSNESSAPAVVATQTQAPASAATTVPTVAATSTLTPGVPTATRTSLSATVATTVAATPTTPQSTRPVGATVPVAIVEPSPNFNSWTYEPGDLTVHVGDTVIWTNTGAAAHTVTTDDGALFDSGTMKPDDTFSFTCTTAGTFPYHCTFHPWMKATITVVGG